MPDCQLPTLGWKKTASWNEHFHPFLINIPKTWHLHLLYSARGALFQITFHEKFEFWCETLSGENSLTCFLLCLLILGYGERGSGKLCPKLQGSANGEETCESITNPEGSGPMSCLRKNYS